MRFGSLLSTSIGLFVNTSTHSHDSEKLAGGRLFWVSVGVVSVALMIFWMLIPWQWSPVDDPGQVLAMRGLFESQGVIGGILERISQLASGDLAGGVFRPLAWVYPPLLYGLPVDLAHLIRLIMVIIIILGPLVYFRRNGARLPLLGIIFILLLIAAGTLYQGLLLLSIQEVGGITLISLGLMVNGRISRLVFWLLAAWFKGPFLWILFGYSIVLWREGRRKLALTSAGLGAATLLINFWWSRSGTYTGRYSINVFDPELWNRASSILEPVNGAILIAALWWLLVTQAPIARGKDFPIFAFAAIGYYVQMIPWGFTAYYMGPISFLLGLLIASVLTNPQNVRLRTLVIGFVIPILIAIWILKASLTFVFDTNSLMLQASECLSQVPNSQTELLGNWLYVTSSEEGPIRIAENTQINNPEWSGIVNLDSTLSGGERDTNTSHLLLLPGSSLPALPNQIICEKSQVVLVNID